GSLSQDLGGADNRLAPEPVNDHSHQQGRGGRQPARRYAKDSPTSRWRNIGVDFPQLAAQTTPWLWRRRQQRFHHSLAISHVIGDAGLQILKPRAAPPASSQMSLRPV